MILEVVGGARHGLRLFIEISGEVRSQAVDHECQLRDKLACERLQANTLDALVQHVKRDGADPQAHLVFMSKRTNVKRQGGVAHFFRNGPHLSRNGNSHINLHSATIAKTGIVQIRPDSGNKLSTVK